MKALTHTEYVNAPFEAQADTLRALPSLWRDAAYYLCRRSGQRGTDKQIAAYRYTLPTAVVRMAIERGFTY